MPLKLPWNETTFSILIMFKKIIRHLKDPYYSFGYDLLNRFPNLMSDKYYLSVLWRLSMGYKLDWGNPKTYNEKLQWLKLNDRNPLYTTLVDKYRVKQWVIDKIGEKYVIPTLGVYNSVDEIDLDVLPNEFVLKCNHDSRSVVLCIDKSTFDFEAAKNKLSNSLKHDFFLDGREWPYKNVKRCIIAEKYMKDAGSDDLPDYKFFTFNGKVKALFIATERNNTSVETCFDFYDAGFNHIDVINGHPNASSRPNKPKCFDEMISIAEVLSQGIPQVRCDLYEINGKVYFGEMTFFHWSGMTRFDPPSFDEEMGNWISLPHN